MVCLPVAITRDEGPRARIFRIILPYKRLSSKLIAPTAHAKPNKCNRAHRLYRCKIVCDRARNQTRKFLRDTVQLNNAGLPYSRISSFKLPRYRPIEKSIWIFHEFLHFDKWPSSQRSVFLPCEFYTTIFTRLLDRYFLSRNV